MWFKSWEHMRSPGKSTVTVIGQEAKTDHDGYERWWSEFLRSIVLKKK